ncbi:hypothetical protein CY34DRAFT_800760 [Suillus luteus UH-Slu-Lm8-n1]|uniref:Uncharacterized protein n=1 Tax=Suillus luteus UH-Slu-Lm8-n1 TaxID=930992 RepID=A0A0D0B8U6_9AGAM|nr:hypothetical protein CY34DRAFT_800760 [Suillus luteus UH-Slu-Lm8-n1]
MVLIMLQIMLHGYNCSSQRPKSPIGSVSRIIDVLAVEIVQDYRKLGRGCQLNNRILSTEGSPDML